VVNDGDQPGAKGRPRKGVTTITPWAGGARGCQPARDAGIMAADTEYVAIIDGHMDFEPGTFAALVEHLESNPRDVVCSRCCHLGMPGWIKPDEQGYSGAFMLWQEGRVPLVPKWRDVDTPAEVPCVLGACYAFRRDRYVETLRRPWRMGTSWGRDEEMLSIINWLCGGENRVVNKRAWHWFREHKQVPYETSAGTIAGNLANHWRMLQVLPLPDKWRQELEAGLMSDPMFKSQWKIIQDKLNTAGINDMRNWLKNQRRTMEEWRALYCCDRDPRPKHGGDVANRPGYMKPKPGQAPAPVHYIGTRVAPGIMPCPRGHDHPVRVVGTYPNGNRQMQCTVCDRKYIDHTAKK
jgi:hypothetical protein